MKQVKILNVKINIISKQEVLGKIQNLLTLAQENKKQCQLITTNPEFILKAQKDEEFKNIINNAWLSVADGYGVRLASKYCLLASKIKNQKLKIKVFKNFLTGFKIAWWGMTRNDKKLDVVKEVITGTDLILEICKIINYESKIKNNAKKIFLLGGFGEVPRLTAKKLKQQFPKVNFDYSIFESKDIIDKINKTKPDILFVALNHPRAQKWIAKNLSRMPSVKLAIGVGGAFDYISGKVKRAPHKMRYSFEWLFRLIRQPKRIKRIWNAVVKFPWLVFKNSLMEKEFKNVN